MKKQIKAWAIVWEKESSRVYGTKENEIVYFVNRDGTSTDDSLCIFPAKNIAIKYLSGNPDWKVLPVLLILFPQKLKPKKTNQ